MKKFLLLLLAALLFNNVKAQFHKTEVTHYIFPEFIDGTVLMKSGIKNTTMLNYNSLTEEMIFINNGKKLAISHLEQIDTVYIKNRTFFPLQNKFVELIYRNKFELYAIHKCNLVDPGKPAAYGGTSQTSATTTYSSYYASGQAYELQMPEGTETKAYTEYWLKRDGKLTIFVSLRQLSKIFSAKSDLFKKFVKEKKVDYDDQESIVQLIKFMENN